MSQFTKSREKVPWFVRARLSPAEVRRFLQRRRRVLSSYPEKVWKAFLERKAAGALQVEERGGNTMILSPCCRKRLYRFFITRDRGVVAEAENSRRVHDLIAGYVCWRCCSVFFVPDLEKAHIM